jgi:predicted NBD/HSP70 family sugar kinase
MSDRAIKMICVGRTPVYRQPLLFILHSSFIILHSLPPPLSLFIIITVIKSPVISDLRQREVVRQLFLEGPLSRFELHQKTGMTPNGVGTVVESLLKEQLVRECPPEPSGGGRPRVPIELDPASRHVVGIAISPGRVEAARIGIKGHLIGSPISKSISHPKQLVAGATDLLKRIVNRQTHLIGVSVTGFLDAETREILFSSATPGFGSVSLAALSNQAGPIPLILENDMHATAARWQLTHRAQEKEDSILVGFDDGALGAAMLIDGRPNRGCATGASELGHTRFFADTDRCYCGQLGCLERIVSSDFLSRHGAAAGTTLADAVARFDGSDPALEELVRHLAMGIANACNFVRPCRLVLVSKLIRQPAFASLLVRSIRSLLLVQLADRVHIDLWDQPSINTAETAGWLALASLYREGWHSTAAA